MLNITEFERVFHSVHPRLYAYCCKYIEDSELAKDIVQDCFVNLWDNQTEISVSHESYLFRAVHNRCISHFRSLKVHAGYAVHVKHKLNPFCSLSGWK